MKHHVYSIAFGIIFICAWAGHAEAIPVAGTYTLSTPFLTGTFTSTGASLSAWNFDDTFSNTIYSGFPVSPNTTSIITNDGVEFIQGTLFSPRIQITWATNRVQSFKSATSSISSQNGTTIEPIPEPSTMLLLTTGLLALAGYRWHQRRHEGTQLV